MLDVSFAFDLGQWVVTPFHDRGYVTSNMIDEGGVLKTFVKCKSRSGWYLESVIRELPETELKLEGEGSSGKA